MVIEAENIPNWNNLKAVNAINELFDYMTLEEDQEMTDVLIVSREFGFFKKTPR